MGSRSWCDMRCSKIDIGQSSCESLMSTIQRHPTSDALAVSMSRQHQPPLEQTPCIALLQILDAQTPGTCCVFTHVTHTVKGPPLTEIATDPREVCAAKVGTRQDTAMPCWRVELYLQISPVGMLRLDRDFHRLQHRQITHSKTVVQAQTRIGCIRLTRGCGRAAHLT